jgi:SPP1 family predicted phage head-tail adaptor
MAINIGKLRHRIEIQSYTTTDDAFGHPVKSWTTRATVWAYVRPLSGREKLSAEQVVGEVTHKIVIRYYDSISPTNRLKLGGRYFDINFIGDYDERNEFMEIMAVEKIGPVWKVAFDGADSSNPIEKGDALTGNDTTPGDALCSKIRYDSAAAGTIWYTEMTHQFVNNEVITGGGNTVTVNGTPELI